MGIDVRAPDGRTWTVRRRLRWPRWRRKLDGPSWQYMTWSNGGDDLAGIVFAIVAALLLAIVLTLVVVLLLPLVIFLVEAAAAVVAAIVLGRRWLVVAATSGPPPEKRVWQVRGFLASRRAVREVAERLRSGVDPAPRDAAR